MTPSPAALPAFDPPYFLGGSAFIAVCYARPARGANVPSPVHLGHDLEGSPSVRGLCVIVVARYTAPPAALPVSYCELIVSKLGVSLRGLVSRPLWMRLDAQLPVAMGIEHYAMPKRFDASLSLVEDEGAVALTGRELSLAFRASAHALSWLLAPLAALLALGAYGFTRLVPVLCESGERSVRSHVVLHPRARAVPGTLVRRSLGDAELWPLLAFRLPRVFTELGPPSSTRPEPP